MHSTGNKSLTKPQLIQQLQGYLQDGLVKRLAAKANYTREGVRLWVNMPDRKSIRLMKAARELLAEEEAAAQARKEVRRRLKDSA